MTRAGQLGGLGVAALLVLVCGCKNDAPSPTEASASASAVPEAPAGEPKGEYREAAFDLVLRPLTTFSVGKPGTVEVLLMAKGGYHMNDTYPYRFKAHDGNGLKFGKPTYTRESMEFKEGLGSLPLEVTPDSTGTKTVSGLFLFSVCSAERCLVEKRELKTDVAVD